MAPQQGTKQVLDVEGGAGGSGDDDLSNFSGMDDDPSQDHSSEGSALGVSLENSSNDGHSSSGNSTGNSSYDLFGFTRFHFQAVSSARWVFLGTLLLAAVGLSTGVYFLLEDEQADDFQLEFDNLAVEVIDVANEHVMNVFQLMDGLTTTVTSFIEVQSEDPNFAYPSGFITLPHMEQHFGSARNASGATLLAYVPVVESDQLELWANYSLENQGWIAKANGGEEVAQPILKDIWDYEDDSHDNGFHEYLRKCVENSELEQLDFDTTSLTRVPHKPEDGPFSPVWTFSPAPKPSDTTIINHDLFAREQFQQAIKSVDATRKPLFIDVCNLASWFNIEKETNYLEAVVVYPVFDGFSTSSDKREEEEDKMRMIVGHMIEIIPFAYFFENILPEGTLPLEVVLESSCGRTSTYEIRGRDVKLLSRDTDLHNQDYDSMVVTSIFADFANSPDLLLIEEEQQEQLASGMDNETAAATAAGICIYTVSVYPTVEFEAVYDSPKPMHYALVVLGVFLCTALLFLLFDVLMTRQRDQVMETAKKQNAIVSSLFPKNIQAKMMQQVDMENNKLSKMGKAGLKNYLFDIQTNGGFGGGAGGGVGGGDHVANNNHTNAALAGKGFGPSDKTKPIADLFPETTIMFGDIAGFTAWSSAREPSQVFILLETIYHEFDMIAKRRRVFKVEVVGDCYVAVCGLPDPRADHAVVMAKFAMECVREMSRLVNELEIELGPDTAELALRVGLHSGPVVAGVLRGEKSRFQLFGDTMNTAARMESNGIPNMVQISQETADLLVVGNKKHWFEPRTEKIQAKGKGALTTYFLKMNHGIDRKSSTMSSSSSHSSSTDDASTSGSLHSFRDEAEVIEKRNRIADWTVETMAGLLKEIVVRRMAANTKSDPSHKLFRIENQASFSKDGSTVISEVQEIIELPQFDAEAATKEGEIDANAVTLPAEVVDELREFVRTIASMYHENPFHNFPHANHVTMSVVKLLSRIVAPDVEEVHSSLHDHTYGITSDPLTRFSVVLAALIHDVDHMGVPNAQLVKEGDPVAELYNNQSVAEQNSIDIAWDLLMEPRFMHLRRQIYTTEAEFKRFRQLVVNSVLATDIMDKDLKELRNKRWATAFAVEGDKSTRQAVNRKATIVIEHLIQASDVAHTMQHWHIYRKWNERLFQEMYKAYEEGRMEQNPADNWYKGEIGFFDFYIIPLAKKLKDCGVFGVSSDEYLSYALQNRKEWEARGETIVETMVRSVKRKTVAQSVFAAAQAAIDLQGREIVADMSASLRRDALEKSQRRDQVEKSPPARSNTNTSKTSSSSSSPRGSDNPIATSTATNKAHRTSLTNHRDDKDDDDEEDDEYAVGLKQ